MAGHGHDVLNCQAASEMKLRTRYSALDLLGAARNGQADWAPAWRDAGSRPPIGAAEPQLL